MPNHWGDTYVPVGDINMKFNEEAKSYGFRDGDVLVAADGKLFKDFSADLYRMLSEARDVEIVRNGKHEHVSLPGDLNLLNMLKSEPRFVEPFLPADVDSVLSGTPAESIGLEAGDKILSLNGRPIDSYNTFRYEIERLADLLAVAKTHEDSMKVRTVTLTFKGTQRDTLASAQTINGTEVPSQVAVAQYGAITKQVVLTEELKGEPINVKEWRREYDDLRAEYAGLRAQYNPLKEELAKLRMVRYQVARVIGDREPNQQIQHHKTIEGR